MRSSNNATTSEIFRLLDVFGGDTTPGHLLSREALALVEPRLAPGGVLAANLITELAPKPWVLSSVVRTMRTVFDVVEIHPTFDASVAGSGFGNVVVIAYDGPRRPVRRDDLFREPAHRLAAESVTGILGREWMLPSEAPGTILTDEFNPIRFFRIAALASGFGPQSSQGQISTSFSEKNPRCRDSDSDPGSWRSVPRSR